MSGPFERWRIPLIPSAGRGRSGSSVIDDPDCFAIADIAQFETALINLASRRDAMYGEGQLTIGVRKVSDHSCRFPRPSARGGNSSPSR